MKKERLAHHLNCIKMCESDKAIERRINEIFLDGTSVGWKESGQCPKCMKDLPEIVRYCDDCEKDVNVGTDEGGKDV